MTTSQLKSLGKNWVPPALWRCLQQMSGETIRFYGEFANWQEAAAKCPGYGADHILTKVLDATLKVRRGEAAYERDSVVFDRPEFVWPIVASLMWAAARNSGEINVLDFGGALGSTYHQNQRFLNSLTKVRWNIVEQLHYVAAGKEHLEDERLKFYPTVASCLAETQPNVILLSSVLQYLEKPFDTLNILSDCCAPVMIIDRTPFSLLIGHRLVVQKVPPKIYEASYPMWVFAFEQFQQTLAMNWTLVCRMPCADGRFKMSSGLNFSFDGLLFEARQ